MDRPKSKKSLGPIVCIYLASYVYLTMIICLYVLSSSSPSLCLWAVMSPFIRHITVSILSHTLNWGVAFACPRGFLVICLQLAHSVFLCMPFLPAAVCPTSCAVTVYHGLFLYFVSVPLQLNLLFISPSHCDLPFSLRFLCLIPFLFASACPILFCTSCIPFHPSFTSLLCLCPHWSLSVSPPFLFVCPFPLATTVSHPIFRYERLCRQGILFLSFKQLCFVFSSLSTPLFIHQSVLLFLTLSLAILPLVSVSVYSPCLSTYLRTYTVVCFASLYFLFRLHTRFCVRSNIY